MGFFVISGPRDAGPGERELMLDKARERFTEAGITDQQRIDVPPKGTAESGEGQLRDTVQGIVPALQSGSLFGDASGVCVVDAQNLLKGEAEVIAELIAAADSDAVTAVFTAAGAIPAPLGSTLKKHGTVESVKKMRERDAARWLSDAAAERKLKIDSGAVSVLVRRFGSDVAAMGQALDQLAVDGSTITESDVLGRYSNRPDEPMWLLADAISAGDEAQALRRLADFLEHGHPLALLSFLEGEVRRRSLAAIAPDQETYASWVGGAPGSYPVRKVWERRRSTRGEGLRRSLDALARADIQIKTAPEPTHRVTLERLVVAMCFWLGR
ncbi:MAG: DNA polymerase III subunit delta [Actinomycetota bacterium]